MPFNDRHGATDDLEPPLVERCRKQYPAQDVHNVPGGEITGVTAAFDDGLSFARSQRLHDDACRAPVVKSRHRQPLPQG